MKSKKSQAMVEYAIVVLFFLFVIIFMFFAFLDSAPEEYSNIKQQESCSNSESIADALYNYQGEPADWNESTSISKLGVSTGDYYDINYTKWISMENKGYVEVINQTNMTFHMNIDYQIYAFNLTEDTTPDPLPDQTSVDAFIVRASDHISVYGGSSGNGADLNLKLFFPFSTVAFESCGSGGLEAGDTNTSTARNGGSEVEINWEISSGDLDCTNITINSSARISIHKIIRIIKFIYWKRVFHLHW